MKDLGFTLDKEKKPNYLDPHKSFQTLSKLQENINDDRLKYSELVKHGLWGRPQRAAHLPLELSKYK